MARFSDGKNPRARHVDIIEKKCPHCAHGSAFLKQNILGKYKCSRCKRRYG